MATWRELLGIAMRDWDDPGPVVAFAPDTMAFDAEFVNRHDSSEESADVLAWTRRRVYFPVIYDGLRWLESAPRNPVSDGQEPVGSTTVPDEGVDPKESR